MRIRVALSALALATAVPLAALHAQAGSIVGTVAAAHAAVGDVVVFLVPLSPATPPATAPAAAEMDQRSLQFSPRVVVVSPGSTVSFTNSDRVMHNVFHPPKGGSAFDLGLFGPGERRSFAFKDEGAYVVFCHVHPEMVGYVVVVATPWHAVSDDAGHFTIEDVPAGSYELRTWHGRFAEHRQQVVVAAGERATVEIGLVRGTAVEPRTAPPPNR